MRMRIHFVGLAVRRPTRVTDAGRACERLAREALLEVLEFAFGAAAREMPAFQRGDARRIIAAIFEPLKRLDHFYGDRLTSEYSDDPAHGWSMPPDLSRTMPKPGLNAANAAKKSQSLSVCCGNR